MTHIISALSNKKQRETLTFTIESQLSCKVTEATTITEVLEPILKGTEIHFIILEHPAMTEPVQKILTAVEKKIPLILYVPKGRPENPALSAQIVGVVTDQNLFDGTLEILSKHVLPIPKLEKAPESVEEKNLDDTHFCRIKVNLLRDSHEIFSDVYIRLRANKYIKLLNKGDSFDTQDREKILNDKKIEHLYVPLQEATAYVNRFKNELQRLLNDEKLEGKDTTQISTSVLETTQDLIRRSGVTPEAQAAIKTNILVSIKSMGKSPKLRGILQQLTLDKKSYLSSHSVQLSRLTCAIAVLLEWESDMTFQKLTMAAMLHDIPVEDASLIRIQSRKELEEIASNYSKEKIRNYLLHPAQAAALAREFSELPPDTDTIISQHHEQPDGSGFPRGLTHKQIIPLSCLFIVAHNVMDQMYEKQEKFSIEEYLEATKDLYGVGNFRKIHAALKNLKT